MALSNSTDVGYGNYPIVLSDVLLGKATKDVYTGIRYKHKANDTTYPSSNSYCLRPNEEEPDRFDLSYLSNPDDITYYGKRTARENQYILIFDAVKQHFVLHRLDSSFDMIPMSPSSDSPDINSKTQSINRQKRSSKDIKKVSDSNIEKPQRNVIKPKTTKQPIHEPTSDEDSDDDLTVEYPGGSAQDINKVYSSPIPSYQRQMSESNERDDAFQSNGDGFIDHGFETDGHLGHSKNPPAEISEEDMALEAELEQEFLKESAGNIAADNESDESEEE